MISLRDYQREGIEKIREHLLAGLLRVLYQLPTGGGKSIVMAFMAIEAQRRGRRVLFLVHRDYLIDQLSRTLSLVGCAHGIIAAGYDPDFEATVQIASSLSLIRRFGKYAPFDLIILDEAHRSIAATNTRIVEHYVGATIIGVTASPKRLDGRPLGDLYQALVTGPSMRALIEQGHLSDFEYYAPDTVDMRNVPIKFGDFDQTEMQARVDRPSVTGDIINHYRTLAHGKRAIVFCSSVRYSKRLAESFTSAGIPAMHVDGETSKAERASAFSRFATGELLVLCNVELAVEGLDIPGVEAVILARPTLSLTFHLQSIGRALRVAPGKSRAIILDHVGNWKRHGFPDDEIEWSLASNRKLGKRVKTGDEPPLNIRQCSKCFHVYRPVDACPACGHREPISKRELAFKNGNLVKLDAETRKRLKEEQARKRKHEEGQCRTLEDFQRIERERGYAPGWSRIRWEARKNKKRDNYGR